MVEIATITLFKGDQAVVVNVGSEAEKRRRDQGFGDARGRRRRGRGRGKVEDVSDSALDEAKAPAPEGAPESNGQGDSKPEDAKGR